MLPSSNFHGRPNHPRRRPHKPVVPLAQANRGPGGSRRLAGVDPEGRDLLRRAKAMAKAAEDISEQLRGIGNIGRGNNSDAENNSMLALPPSMISPAMLGRSDTIAQKMKREQRRSRARDMHQSKIRMLEDQDEQHKGAMRTKERLEKAAAEKNAALESAAEHKRMVREEHAHVVRSRKATQEAMREFTGRVGSSKAPTTLPTTEGGISASSPLPSAVLGVSENSMLRKARQLAEAANRMCDEMKEKQRQQDERFRRAVPAHTSRSFVSCVAAAPSGTRAAPPTLSPNSGTIPISEQYHDRNDPILAKAKAMLHDYNPLKVPTMAPSLEAAHVAAASPPGVKSKKHSPSVARPDRRQNKPSGRRGKGAFVLESCRSPGSDDDAAGLELLSRARQLIAGASTAACHD